MILAGDIGGTNARLALFSPDGKKVVREEAIPSRDHPSLESAIVAFLGKKPPKIHAATFGIAGPVVLGRVKTTNLPWSVDEASLARRLKTKRVSLINDLVALGLGALTLAPKKLRLVRGDALPKKRGGTLAVIAAGTGLGEAALVWSGSAFVPVGTEGGHSDFAPRNAVEVELLEYLARRFGEHVSYERVVSGPGIGNVYDFFREKKGLLEATELAAEIATAKDRSAAITRLAVAGKSPVCARAVDLFASLYGAEAGNLALKVLATGGVYVAGGIAAALADTLASGPFVASFLGKGRMKPLLEKIPIAICLDPNIGLAGAAHHAANSHQGAQHHAA